MSFLLLEIRRAEAEVASKVLQRLHLDEQIEAHARDAEKLASKLSISFGEEVKRELDDWFGLYDRAFRSGPVDNSDEAAQERTNLILIANERGLALRAWLETGIKHVRQVLELADACIQSGFAVPSRERLNSVLQKAEERYHGAFDHWQPWLPLTPDEKQGIDESCRRGECISIDDLIAETKSRLASSKS